jgi:prepilin-type N-terminal cleavage/methylation domain-containing protein
MWRRSTTRFTRRNAYTLVEMLVVLGVISVLVGLVVPTLASFRADARSTQCLSNLRQLYVAVDTARQQRSDMLPYASPLPLPGTQALYVHGLPEKLKHIIKPEFDVWLCPSDNTDDSKLLGTSYSYVPGAFMLLEPPIIVLESHEFESNQAREDRVARLITMRYSNGYLKALPVLVDNGDFHKHAGRDPHNAVFMDGTARAIEPADQQIDDPQID